MPLSAGDSTLQRSTRRVGSLRWRVTLLIILLSTIIQGTLCLVIILYNRRSLDGLMNQRIRLRLGQIAQALESLDREPSREDLGRLEAIHLQFVVSERTAITLYDADGRLIVGTTPSAPDAAKLPLAKLLASKQIIVLELSSKSTAWLKDSNLPGARMGLIGAEVNGKPRVVALTVSDNYFHQMATNVERPMVLLIAMGVVASGAAGWLVTGRLLGPLSRLTLLATALRPEHLEQDESGPGVSVSELQSVQQSLRDTRESLREAFRAQERFLSNVAHELKTPIAVLLAEAQTLDKKGLGDDGARFVGSVHEEMKRLGKLVESFLLLAKVHAGKALLKSEVVFVNDVVMAAVEQCGIMARQYSVTLIPTLLEGDTANSTLAGDSVLLQTMFDGIIRNAIKFSPHGGRVEVTTSRGPQVVVVRVTDQGPGIAPEIAGSLFDRFVQSSAESARGRGTGLGLAIAQGIAELHAGKISFQNRPEGGCEFSVRLPNIEATADESADAV